MSDPLDDRPHDRPCLGAEVTDEEIMAYADGVLADERLRAVREELANNPERMKTLEAYLKTREAMAHALGPILVATVPERLRDAIHELAAAPAPARGLGALLRSAVGGHLFAKLRMPMLAVAALCLVFLGAWLGDYAMRHTNPQPERQDLVRWEPRGLVFEPALQRALDATPSGEEAKITDRVAIKPVATLRTKAGVLCREFDLLNAGRLDGRSVACRDSDGSWLIPVPLQQPKEYNVAGGAPPIELGKAMLEGAKQALSGTAVGRDQERDLIGRRWREIP
jgi:hypothetical protein